MILIIAIQKLMIQLNINHLFAHVEVVTSITIQN